jgi:hypothetical protein
MASTRKAGSTLLRLLLLCLAGAGVVAAFWFGVVPQRYSPFAPITLAERPEWFTDFRLAALRTDAGLCRATLKAPHIVAEPIADRPFVNGCGWLNAVRISSAGGAELSAAQLTCPAAAALALWIEYEVQPAAVQAFGTRVKEIGTLGTYACRNIVGNRKWAEMRSQHASANAIDIATFRLEDGRSISVKGQWKGNDPAAGFLRTAHAGACRYFRVALSPDFNPAHEDHFHLDRGVFTRCK